MSLSGSQSCSQRSVVCWHFIIPASSRQWQCHKSNQLALAEVLTRRPRWWGGKKGVLSCGWETWLQGCTSSDTWSYKTNRKQAAIFSGHKSRIQHVIHHGWWCVLLTALGTLERGDWCNMRGHVSLFMRFAVAGCVLSECVWPFLWGEWVFEKHGKYGDRLPLKRGSVGVYAGTRMRRRTCP